MVLFSEIELAYNDQQEYLISNDKGIERYLYNRPGQTGHIDIITGIRRCGKSTYMNQLSVSIKGDFSFFTFEDSRVFGFDVGDFPKLLQIMGTNKNAYFFIDPPYTIAGKRLYTYFDIDHKKLFELTSQLKGKFMLTYDDTPEIRQLAAKFKLNYKKIPMKTTLHYEKNEIIISDNFSWWTDSNIRKTIPQ